MTAKAGQGADAGQPPPPARTGSDAVPLPPSLTTDGVEGYAPGQTAAAMTKADRAYQHIRQRIIEGQLEAGMPLDQEAIALELQTSTTPLREALNRLESEGLVVYRAHRRTVVAPLTMEALEQIYTVRVALDPLAAGLAAAAATDEEIAYIVALASRTPEQHAFDALHGNRRLHHAIYASCGNAVLIRILDMLWDRSDRYRLKTLNAGGTIALAHEEHLAIALAIRDRNGDDAAELMRHHVASSFERIREADLDA